MSLFDRLDPVWRVYVETRVDETIQSYTSHPKSTARRAKGLRGSSLLPPTLDLSKVDDVTVCTLRALRRDGVFNEWVFNEFGDEELLAMIEERKAT